MQAMKISTHHLKRYKELAVLLWKYGRSDLVSQMGIDHDEAFGSAAKPPPTDAKPEQLADDLEALGPTYVKLGQVLASRPDLLPEPYLKALARLQDKVKPFSYAEVEEIVTTELGVRISKAFSRFDPIPIAAASLGQVHSAALRDGRRVVVKVQRPNIGPQIAEDFEVLEQIAEFLDTHTEIGRRYRFLSVLEEFRITIQQELNYELEAQNLITVGRNVEEFALIDIPQPIPDYSTRRVLTMDYVRGRKITSLGPLAFLELEGEVLADQLFKAYLKQVLVDGLFHADPHPGNVFLTNAGHVALLDLGMMGHTTPAMQRNLLKILIAVSEGNSDAAASVVIDISEAMEDFDATAFHRRARQLLVAQPNQDLRQMNVGVTLLHVSKAACDCGLYVPSELTLLGKTLLQLDEVGRILDPEFDPNASVRRNVGELMSQRVNKDATKGSVVSTLLEMKEFAANLPARLNKIMDAITNPQWEIKVRAVDANLAMEGLQKVANRITSGIILAALIIGAALLMRVETTSRLFGYPSLAILLFLAAAAGGCWLLVSIAVQDQRSKKKPAR